MKSYQLAIVFYVCARTARVRHKQVRWSVIIDEMHQLNPLFLFPSLFLHTFSLRLWYEWIFNFIRALHESQLVESRR